MSLSSQYLEELSRRYKKQVEEMQRLFDKTLNTLTAESKKKDEHNKRLERELQELKQLVDGLVAERNSWSRSLYWLFVMAVLIFCFFSFCRRAGSGARPSVEIQRRNSIDVITRRAPKKQRRPSEEALKIKGSYKELMVDEIDGHAARTGKKRKKRKESPKSNNFATVAEESENSRQESAPSVLAGEDWVESNAVKDVPVVLEESEHTSLEFAPSMNGDAKHLQSFVRTATETRLNRSSSHTPPRDTNGNKVEKHRKSASVDETTRMESLNGNVLAESGTPKKERKSLFKIFKRK